MACTNAVTKNLTRLRVQPMLGEPIVNLTMIIDHRTSTMICSYYGKKKLNTLCSTDCDPGLNSRLNVET